VDTPSDKSMYTIGVIAGELKVHPETIRVWERSGLILPSRVNGRRLYSENDLKRLRFILYLIGEGLNIPAILHYIQLYPCWKMNCCPGCMHRSKSARCSKRCWKEDDTYCQVFGQEGACLNCDFCKAR
jgi:MerR family transcriptional regulator, heat shock protein HspR